MTIRERNENGLKSGKIDGNASQQIIVKNPYGGFSKKKEREASVVMENIHPRFQAPMAPMSYCSY